MSRPSDEKLAAALREAGLGDLAQRAQRGEWNDYFGSHRTPKMHLARILRALAITDERVRGVLHRLTTSSEFDSGRDEGEAWVRSPEGKAAMRELVGGD